MKKPILLAILLTCVLQATLGANDKSVSGPLRVFVLAGQSNMQGKDNSKQVGAAGKKAVATYGP